MLCMEPRGAKNAGKTMRAAERQNRSIKSTEQMFLFVLYFLISLC